MKSWTSDASEHFEHWLGRVRTSMAGDPSVDADDVAQDLRAHVHAELAAGPEPVTVGELQRVLESLGTPAQWIVNGKEPSKERLHVRLERNVAELLRDAQKRVAGDWGVPLLLGVVTSGGLLTLYDGPGILLLALAYFVARAQVTHAPDAVTGRRRWLVLLPIALGAASLTAIVLYFPMMLEPGWARSPHSSFSAAEMWWIGLWWMFVAYVAGREVKRVRALLKPFADGFERTHARMLMLLGAALMIAATIALFPRRW
jgi:hypothetical protein